LYAHELWELNLFIENILENYLIIAKRDAQQERLT
jgi:hypothetical protein